LVTLLIWVQLLKTQAGCMVWTSLIVVPCIIIALGVALLVLGQLIPGGIVLALGLCNLALMFCWKDFVPFTIQIAETLATVMKEIPGAVGVSFLGGFLGIMWPFACLLTMIAIQAGAPLQSRNEAYAVIFVLLWGIAVASYYTHTMLCGIYGRWYYSKDKGREVMTSIKAASTSHFGSICYGAFIIAAVRTLEIAVRQMQRDAMEDGNMALVVILCIVKSLIRCLGDAIEYMSEWVYVQVAVRGTSFCEGAQVCYAMLTYGNMQFILSDMIIDYLGILAMLMCICAGVGGGVLGVFLRGGGDATAMIQGAVLGLIPGIFVGSTAGSIITAGSKTILMSWAENPDELQRSRPELHAAFHEKMVSKF